MAWQSRVAWWLTGAWYGMGQWDDYQQLLLVQFVPPFPTKHQQHQFTKKLRTPNLPKNRPWRDQCEDGGHRWAETIWEVPLQVRLSWQRTQCQGPARPQPHATGPFQEYLGGYFGSTSRVSNFLCFGSCWDLHDPVAIWPTCWWGPLKGTATIADHLNLHPSIHLSLSRYLCI